MTNQAFFVKFFVRIYFFCVANTITHSFVGRELIILDLLGSEAENDTLTFFTKKQKLSEIFKEYFIRDVLFIVEHVLLLL